jgi:hypothetical protein
MPPMPSRFARGSAPRGISKKASSESLPMSKK